MKCSHPSSQNFTLCSQCGDLVLPSESTTYFELFQIPVRYAIDQGQIQKKFYEYSRTLHPDRFQNSSAQNLNLATQWFAKLNTALATLRSADERANYLFSLVNFHPAAEKSNLPPALAEDYFTLQETLEEDDTSLEEKAKGVGEFAEKIEKLTEASEIKRDEIFHEWEIAGSPLNEVALPYFKRAAANLKERSYLTSMAHDLENKWPR